MADIERMPEGVAKAQKVHQHCHGALGLGGKLKRVLHGRVGQPASIGRIRHDVPGSGLPLGQEIPSRFAIAVVDQVRGYDFISGCDQFPGNPACSAGWFPDGAVERLRREEGARCLWRRRVKLIGGPVGMKPWPEPEGTGGFGYNAACA